MKTRGKFISARGTSGEVWRPNKLAAGIQTTATRSGHLRGLAIDKPALTLAVRGTFDPLSTLVNRNVKLDRTKTCQCCGQPIPRLVLSDAGRKRLARLRLIRSRAQNVQG